MRQCRAITLTPDGTSMLATTRRAHRTGPPNVPPVRRCAAKILHVATFIFPDLMAGAERFVRGTARAQAARGHDVTVIAGNPWGLPAEERRDGFRLLRYPLRKERGFRFYQDVRHQVESTLQTLSRERFDVLHAHQLASAVPALSASFPARKVLSFHASYRLEFEAERLDGQPAGDHRTLGLSEKLKSLAIGVLDRQCLQKAERIVVHSRFVLGQVEHLMPSALDRLRIVPPGVDLERFSPGDRDTARRKFDLPADVPLVVTVRRLARRMGIDLLLRAIHRLVARGIPVGLAIGGVGPERDALEGLCRELRLEPHVRFLGRVPDELLPELLRAADVFVLPTRSMEGFGMVTIEAMASGTPVVATDNGATPEILSAVDLGLLTPADPDALAAALERLLANAELRRALAVRGVEVVRSRYTWDACVTDLDKVYEELCGAAARA